MKFSELKSTLKYIYPSPILLMTCYIQILAWLINPALFDTRELAIMLVWIPVLTSVLVISQHRMVYVLLYFIFFIDGFINLVHLLVLKGPLTASSLFVLMNTNAGEASEFFALKQGPMMLLILPFIGYFLYSLLKLTKPREKALSPVILTMVFAISLVFIGENSFHERLVRKGIPRTGKVLISLREELHAFARLKQRKVMQVEATINAQQSLDNVVLIIGESGSRRHMSIYGYVRNTTPRLLARKDLDIFTNVITPYSHTLNAVLSMLTESNIDNHMGYDQAVSLIDVFHSAGYTTYWISNQSPIGIWDNGIYNLAKTADHSEFINHTASSSFETMGTGLPDEVLFAPFTEALNDTGRKFIVLHLMGNHSFYAKRYPPSFDQFNGGDDKVSNTINAYDNSILYNDYVTDSLFKLLQTKTQLTGKKSMALMLSDHGENVYDEGHNAGHDYAGIIPHSNIEVPFMVWISPSFQWASQPTCEVMKAAHNKPFMTDDLFHAILDISGISTKYLNPERSIFNSKYQEHRKRILEDQRDYDASELVK